MKVFNSAELALIKNNILELCSNRKYRYMFLLIPALISIIIPLVFLLIALLTDVSSDLQRLLFLLPECALEYNAEQTVFCFATNLILPMLFTVIPVVCSAVACAVCYVGEKENRTIGTLLSTPVSAWQTVNSKIVSSILTAVVITLLSSIFTITTAGIGNIILQSVFFFDVTWLITVLLLSPALSMLASLIVIISASGKSETGRSSKTSSFIILPILFMYILQFTGAYKLSSLVLLIISALLFAADFIIVFILKNSFTTEKILR